MKTLTEIGKGKTDKAGKFHRYTDDVYPMYLEKLRHEPVTLLEIGLGTKGSCKMWSEYFDAKGCKFIGIDQCRSKRLNRWEFHVIDQANPEVIAAVGLEHRPLDIVIDDGSHHAEHQRSSFEALWPHVAPGGLYFIEDIQCSYTRAVSLMPYLFQTVEEVVTVRMKPQHRKESLSSKGKAFVHFYPHIAVIGKCNTS